MQSLHIEKAIKELAKREQELEELWDDFVEKEHAFECAYTATFLKEEGSIELRKELAKSATFDLRLERDKAEAKLKLMQIKVKDCIQVISARQSILSSETRVHGVSDRYTT